MANSNGNECDRWNEDRINFSRFSALIRRVSSLKRWTQSGHTNIRANGPIKEQSNPNDEKIVPQSWKLKIKSRLERISLAKSRSMNNFSGENRGLALHHLCAPPDDRCFDGNVPFTQPDNHRKCNLRKKRDAFRSMDNIPSQKIRESIDIRVKYDSLPIEDKNDSRLNSLDACSSRILNINPSSHLRVIMVRKLGEGANGCCHEVKVQSVHTTCSNVLCTQVPGRRTLKIIPQSVYLEKRLAIRREIHLQRQLNQTNVLRLFLAYYDSAMKSICILLEYCALGSLTDLLNNASLSAINHEGSSAQSSILYDYRTGGLHATTALIIFHGLLLAMNHLHVHHAIIHRDIKPGNILLTNGFVPKLSDFGLACSVEQGQRERNHICGTPNYMAPEIFLQFGHSPASDCWSAGATLYYMVCGRPSFDQDYRSVKCVPSGIDRNIVSMEMSPKARVRLICRNILWGRYAFPTNLEQSLRKIIGSLLQRIPNERPRVCELLKVTFDELHTRSQNRNGPENIHSEFPSKEHMTLAFVGQKTEQNSLNSNCPTIPWFRIADHIPDSVYTGKEAIFDIFRLLNNRVNQSDTTGDKAVNFHWVSRWAVTTERLLYYTMENVWYQIKPDELRSEVRLVNDSYKTTPGKSHCRGVTSQTGDGVIISNQRYLQFERSSSTEKEPIRLPTYNEIETNCETLLKQLSCFTPINPVTQRMNQQEGITSSPEFVQRWKQHGNNVLFAFSSGGWQVNFHDHSKLMVHYPDTWTYYSTMTKDICAEVVVFKSESDLETKFHKWVAAHPDHRMILQHLLFELL